MYYLGKRLGLMAIILAAAFCFSAANAAAQQEITAGMLGENILDMEVRTQAGEEVGEIEDVIFDKRGKIDKFILDIGEFLGLGGKRVSVSRKELRYNEEGGFAVYQGTESDLEAMPEIEYYDYRYGYGYGYGYGPGRGYYRPYYAPYSTPGYYDPYYADRYPPQYGYDPTRDEEGMQGRDMAQRRRRMERRPYMDQRGRDERGMRQREQRSDRGRYMEQRGQGDTGRRYDRSRMQAGEIPMERLIDAIVRTQGGETVGSVKNLIVNPRGRISHVVMDVGGFLGIGDKRVAVPFDQLENAGPYYVIYPGTEKELENMPEFDPERKLEQARGWLRPQARTGE